jgi:hypothetical protein
MSDPLDKLAARVSTDPAFLGYALAACQSRDNLDDAALADVLGCPVATLTQLRLCRTPGTHPGGNIIRDTEEIGERFGVSAMLLRWIVLQYSPPPAP